MKNNKKKIPGRVILKYIILQVPALAILTIVLQLINLYIEYPIYIRIIIMSAWLLKDIAMFPLVWQSYDTPVGDVMSDMIGREGIVRSGFNGEGYVEIGMELWNAEIENAGSPVVKGDVVKVVAVKPGALTLIVKKI